MPSCKTSSTFPPLREPLPSKERGRAILKVLREDAESRVDALRIVHAVVNVEAADLLHVLLWELKRQNVEVAQQPVVVVALGDNSQTLLNSPAKENLCRSYCDRAFDQREISIVGFITMRTFTACLGDLGDEVVRDDRGVVAFWVERFGERPDFGESFSISL